MEARTQVLGVSWHTEADCLYINVDEFTNKLKDGPMTKRKLLQTTASFYDPLGLYSPVSLLGKIFFQATWCRGFHWDDLLPTAWERDGTLVYLVCLHCRRCTSLEGWQLLWN